MLPCRLLWLLDHECDPLYRLSVCVPGEECPAARSSASRASSASQSVSCSVYFPLRQSFPLAHSTPRSASPIPVPRPPRTSPYWVRHFQILNGVGNSRQCGAMTFYLILTVSKGWMRNIPAILGVGTPDTATARLAEPDACVRRAGTYGALHCARGKEDVGALRRLREASNW